MAADYVPEVCIGIDFGTSMTGYTFAQSLDGRINVPYKYTDNDTPCVPKTATALLYKVAAGGAWIPEAWGSKAVHDYIRHGTNDATRYRLIDGKQVKMMLYEGDGANELSSDFKLPPGCPLQPQQVIADYLKFLRGHMAKELKGHHATLGTGTSYCLSVPAGWSNYAKSVMEAAAKDAGLDGARPISIVHEPEAAAVTACHDPDRNWPKLQPVPGDVWVIVDAGGGTVDIAMHRIETAAGGTTDRKCKLSEVLRSRCIPNGSTRLDEQAFKFIFKPLFANAPDKYVEWTENQPWSVRKQMDYWQAAKHNFRGDNTVTVDVVPWLQQNIGAPPYLDLQPGRLQAEVFNPVFVDILQGVNELLSVPRKKDGKRGAEVLVVVGGLGNNDYFCDEIKRVCWPLVQKDSHGTPKIICPKTVASKAVVLGNTIHLQHPGSIIARCSRLTYCVAVACAPTDHCRKFGEVGLNPKKTMELCKSHLKVLVSKGSQVDLDTWIDYPGNPLVPQQGAKEAVITIYTTDMENPHHIQPGMIKVANLEIKVEKHIDYLLGFIPVKTQSYKDYRIDVRFKLGTSQLEVEARDHTTGKRYDASLTFVNEVVRENAVLL